jgi:hypothetical protein
VSTLQQLIEDMELDKWAALTKRVAENAVASARRLGRQPPRELVAAAAMSEHELIERRKRGQGVLDDGRAAEQLETTRIAGDAVTASPTTATNMPQTS